MAYQGEKKKNRAEEMFEIMLVGELSNEIVNEIPARCLLDPGTSEKTNSNKYKTK